MMSIVEKFALVRINNAEWEEAISPSLVGKIGTGDIVAVALPREDDYIIGEVVALRTAPIHAASGLGEIVQVVRPAGAKSLAERREQARAIARRLEERSAFVSAVKAAAANCGVPEKRLRKIADEASLALLAELQELDPNDELLNDVLAAIPVAEDVEDGDGDWKYENFLKKEPDPVE